MRVLKFAVRRGDTMNESQGEQREEQLMRLFKMGVTIVDSDDGSIAVRRTGEANLPVEIATISIQNSRISFRRLVRSPGVIPSR